MDMWKSKNRHKYLLQYHLIFVCKYRKQLLIPEISEDIKQMSYEICKKHNIIIKEMETDKNHIHYMIETEPTISISKIVNLLKSYTTFHIWEKHSNFYLVIFGRSVHFGQMVILFVQLAVLVKKP